MKTELVIVTTVMLLCSCGATNDESLIKKENPSTSKTASSTITEGNGIAGEWQLVNTILDQNGNNLLEDDEGQKPMSTKIGNYYLKFNSVGTSLLGEIKLKGRYGVKGDKGEQTILIQSGDEMVLMPSSAPRTSLVYKRI